jgi:CheY-like chemotaxis protein
MNRLEPYEQNHRGTEAKPDFIKKKYAWILGGTLESWWEITHAFSQWGIEAKPLGFDTDLQALAAQAEREGGVIVIDLMNDVERGLGIMNSIQLNSPSVPVIAAVADPSMDLTQRLRDLGAFCLAVHPLNPVKTRDVLEDAFRHVQQHAAAQFSRKKVLIIDDDKDYCRSVKMLLESEGYEVCCAMTGAEGLAKAISSKPDLIILDVMMENAWAGYEVNQTLKFRSGYESVQKVPIVMVSSIEQAPAERFLRSTDSFMISPDVYLTKPLEVKGFVETVRSLLKTSPSVRA